MKKDQAFSGLEAAIVLIAFVVVAAVFSYVMLGAGFFATQKSQEVTYSGIKQTTSNIVLDGQLVGFTSPLVRVEFTISIPEAGQAQKLSDVAFVTTVNGLSLHQPHAGAKTATDSIRFYNNVGTQFASSHVLDTGEKMLVSLVINPSVSAGGSFTIEMKPKVGAATLISKSVATGYTDPGGVII